MGSPFGARLAHLWSKRAYFFSWLLTTRNSVSWFLIEELTRVTVTSNIFINKPWCHTCSIQISRQINSIASDHELGHVVPRIKCRIARRFSYAISFLSFLFLPSQSVANSTYTLSNTFWPNRLCSGSPVYF